MVITKCGYVYCDGDKNVTICGLYVLYAGIYINIPVVVKHLTWQVVTFGQMTTLVSFSA